MLRVMVRKASTRTHETAKVVHKSGRQVEQSQVASMIRIVLVLFILLLLITAVGVVVLGAFPPAPKLEQIQRVLPNDKFAPGR